MCPAPARLPQCPGHPPPLLMCLSLPGALEGRGSTAAPWALARSSPAEPAEPALLGDPEPGSLELQDGPLELWGSDLGSWGLELREEVDGIFPDFLAC